MIGYSEVLQTLGAMVIFSLMLLTANQMISRNTLMQVEGELEQEVVAIAQDVIEEGRTKEFDERSQGPMPPTLIPEDFTAKSNLGPDYSSYSYVDSDNEDDVDGNGNVERTEFDDFDDYHDWTSTVNTEHGEFNIEVEVFYVDPDTYERIETTEKSTFKKMVVTITSKYLNKGPSGSLTEYKLEFIRNYYAD